VDGASLILRRFSSLRLDKFLKVSRIIKRRSVAEAACEAGRVLVGGIPAKPGKQLKEGDVLTILFGEKSLTVRVLSLRETATKDEADELYEVIAK